MTLPRHVRAYNTVLWFCKDREEESTSSYKWSPTHSKELTKMLRKMAHKIQRATRYYFPQTLTTGDVEGNNAKAEAGIFNLPAKAVLFLADIPAGLEHFSGDDISVFYVEQIGKGRISITVFTTDNKHCAVHTSPIIVTAGGDVASGEMYVADVQSVLAGDKIHPEAIKWCVWWFSHLLVLLHMDRDVEEVERFYDMDYQETEEGGVTNIFKTVRIHTEKPRVRYMDPSQDTGRHNRYHGVRGHYAHYSKPIKSGPNQGKTRIFRVAHNRGDLSLGRVYKDYEVEK